MYYSGNAYDFEQRLHALATSIDDLEDYYAESQGYSVSVSMQQRWLKEFDKKRAQFGYYDDFNTGDFLLATDDNIYITDDNSDFILIK